MPSKPAAEIHSFVNPFTARDIAATLREQGWLHRDEEAITPWLAEAIVLLGPRTENREALGVDIRVRRTGRACCPRMSGVLTRRGARDVVRSLATEILNGSPVDSNRLKEIVAATKANLPYSSREIFHPLRVALTGRVGGGELDRAAETKGLTPVKSVRTRIIEFCAALD